MAKREHLPTLRLLKIVTPSALFLAGIFVIIPFANIAGAQGLVNVNPDPNGEPWIAGGVTREQWDSATANLPSLEQVQPSGLRKAAAPPASLDNSQLPAFRPIFNQQGGSCSQASSIGYVFTYEINNIRGVAGNVTDNQYPYDYSYNFLNSGSGNNGANPDQGFAIAMATGIPSVKAYGGFGLAKYTQWVSGYDTYFNGMSNRADTQFTINVKTASGINTMRQWLCDHNNGSAKGGCLVFCFDATGSKLVSLATGTPQAGKKAMVAGGTSGGHAVTIAGYDDSVRYDYNGDGKYTNGTDVSSWEIGALIMVNSWGASYGNSGKIYVPYRFCANDMWSQVVYGVKVSNPAYKPQLTLKVKLSHNQRSQIRIRAGYANSATATAPTGTPKSFAKAFNYSGGTFALQGINSDPIEIGLDVSDFLPKLTASDASLFLLIDSKGGTGTVQSFSLLDYSGGATPVEVVCPQQNVNIAVGTTTLKITKTLSQLMVLTPNGGEKWERGRTFPITWFDRLTEDVKIELLKAGAVQSVISADAPSNGSFQWAVPADLALGTDYKVRISSVTNSSINDVSDNNFAIQEKSILDLTAPNGGEHLEKGKTANITWNSGGSGTVKIDLYNNKILDTTIAASAPNTGSYSWTIPSKMASGFEYTVRITSTDNQWLYDESENYFAILSAIAPSPYTENFDAFPDTSVSENWEQSSDDDLNWTVWKGATPSRVISGGGGTGPTGDHTSGNGKYVYLESSASNHPGKLGVILSPAIDVSKLAGVQIGIWFHMKSTVTNTGDLWVDVNTDGAWKDSVLYLTGDQGDQWFQKVIPLSQAAPAGPSPKLIQVRIRARTGQDYDSDMSFDDFTVTGTPVEAAPAPVALNPGRRLALAGSNLRVRNLRGNLNIYTMDGALVKSSRVPENGAVSVAALPHGFYLARINGEMIKFAR